MSGISVALQASPCVSVSSADPSTMRAGSCQWGADSSLAAAVRPRRPGRAHSGTQAALLEPAVLGR